MASSYRLWLGDSSTQSWTVCQILLCTYTCCSGTCRYARRRKISYCSWVSPPCQCQRKKIVREKNPDPPPPHRRESSEVKVYVSKELDGVTQLHSWRALHILCTSCRCQSLSSSRGLESYMHPWFCLFPSKTMLTSIAQTLRSSHFKSTPNCWW